MKMTKNDKNNIDRKASAPVKLPDGHFCEYLRCSECPAARDGLEWHGGEYMYWCYRFNSWEKAHSGCANPPKD